MQRLDDPGDGEKLQATRGKCIYCNRYRVMTREHVIPRRLGGTIILYACSSCNNHKGGQTLGIWRQTLQRRDQRISSLDSLLRRSPAELSALAKIQNSFLYFPQRQEQFPSRRRRHRFVILKFGLVSYRNRSR